MAITKNEVLQIVVKQGTFNQNDFIEFVNKLFQSALLGRGIERRNYILFMDNAAIHASKKAVSFLDNLGCSVLYNAPYAPELNPIEVVIGAVKRILKTNI